MQYGVRLYDRATRHTCGNRRLVEHASCLKLFVWSNYFEFGNGLDDGFSECFYERYYSSCGNSYSIRLLDDPHCLAGLNCSGKISCLSKTKSGVLSCRRLSPIIFIQDSVLGSFALANNLFLGIKFFLFIFWYFHL